MNKLKMLLLLFVAISCSLAGCKKENNENGEFVPDTPKVVSIEETVNADGDVVLEASFKDESKMYFKITSPNTAEVTNGKVFYGTEEEGYKYRGAVVIPLEIKHSGIVYTITAVGEEAFLECDLLQSIYTPNSVTMIGYRAFSGCTRLESINLPISITSIGAQAFTGCVSLDGIIIPPFLNRICDWTFSDCTSLSSITIPEGIKSIGIGAFNRCTGLLSVSFNAIRCGVVGDDYDMPNVFWFEDCVNIQSLTIGEKVTMIANYAFPCLSGLTEINIPEFVTSIGVGAFGGCTNVVNVHIPNTITTLRGFDGCASLTNITIPSSVTCIGTGAFEATGLTSIDIPNTVTSVGLAAFYHCSGLTSVSFPSSVQSIAQSAFGRCDNLNYIGFSSGTPPSIYDSFEGTNLLGIYVPAQSVELYKTSWPQYSDIIFGV